MYIKINRLMSSIVIVASVLMIVPVTSFAKTEICVRNSGFHPAHICHGGTESAKKCPEVLPFEGRVLKMGAQTAYVYLSRIGKSPVYVPPSITVQPNTSIKISFEENISFSTDRDVFKKCKKHALP